MAGSPSPERLTGRPYKLVAVANTLEEFDRFVAQFDRVVAQEEWLAVRRLKERGTWPFAALRHI